MQSTYSRVTIVYICFAVHALKLFEYSNHESSCLHHGQLQTVKMICHAAKGLNALTQKALTQKAVTQKAYQRLKGVLKPIFGADIVIKFTSFAYQDVLSKV